MRDLQTCPNPCNASSITRSWSRGKRFESARRLSFFLRICRRNRVAYRTPCDVTDTHWHHSDL